MDNTVKLPVGIDNFGFYYIDKADLITELLHNWSEVHLFTRPRRFGKLNIIHIPTDNADETQELLQSLHKKMGSMSYVQLLSLDKFIEDIVPYIK